MPLACAAVGALVVIATGTTGIAAVLTYARAGFVAATVVQEFARGTRARRALHAEGALTAFTNLFRRSGRRYGGYVVHLGIVLVALAIATSQARTVDAEKTLAPGETLSMAGYTVRLDALRTVHEPQRDSVVADLQITGSGGGSPPHPALPPDPRSAPPGRSPRDAAAGPAPPHPHPPAHCP